MGKILALLLTILPFAALALIALALGVLILFWVLRRRRLFADLVALGRYTLRREELEARYPLPRLLRNASLVIKASRHSAENLCSWLGVTRKWAEQFRLRPTADGFLRLLEFAPRENAWDLFLFALPRPKEAARFVRWIDDNTDMMKTRVIPMAFDATKDFDGQRALLLLKDWRDELRELSGDPEGRVRFFAVNLLLHDTENEASERILWEAFSDAAFQVRQLLARQWRPQNAERLYQQLYSLVCNDPVQSVRAAAFERIEAQFPESFKIDETALSDSQKIHLLDFLRPAIIDEENLGFHALESQNPEVRFKAASYLTRIGALEKIFLNVDASDRVSFERNINLLTLAAGVHVSEWLFAVEKSENPSCLLVAARILRGTGPRILLFPVAERIFKLMDGSQEAWSAYGDIVAAIDGRGNDEALKLLKWELERRRELGEYMDVLLPRLTPRGDYLFLPALFDFLQNPAFVRPDALIDAVGRMDPDRTVETLLALVIGEYDHAVRVNALKILASYQMESVVRSLMEHMHLLSLPEARAFAQLLNQMYSPMFRACLKELLGNHDAAVRRALIASLPATGQKDFVPYVLEGLRDSEPMVRSAAVWALVDFGEGLNRSEVYDLLRDPVDEVRADNARALGKSGNRADFDQLAKVLADENEINPVKIAAVEGLKVSARPDAVDLLVSLIVAEEEQSREMVIDGAKSQTAFVDKNSTLIDAAVQALSAKTADAELDLLLKGFSKAAQSARKELARAVKGMGEAGEQKLLEKLSQPDPAIAGWVAEILEATGYVPLQIRKLNHRKPELRREAARVLSLLATPSAYRGIVLSARDPDQSVRVMAVKAMEKLNTEEGRHILESLMQDPDKKIRTYTAWALSRLKAKNRI